MPQRGPIGVFDSGIGGLAVLKHCLARLPAEAYVYFGDTLRRPYGPRPLDEIRRFVLAICDLLITTQGCRIVVIGCNTATVAGLEAARREFSHVPIVGMIDPAVEEVVRTSRNQRIGVLGTKATIESGQYQQAIAAALPGAWVQGVPCEELLRMAELGGELYGYSRQVMLELANQAVAGPLAAGADTVLLACTDFTWIADVMEEAVDGRAAIIDPAEAVAQTVAELASHQLTAPAGSGRCDFYISGDDAEHFSTCVRRFLALPGATVHSRTVLPAR